MSRVSITVRGVGDSRLVSLGREGPSGLTLVVHRVLYSDGTMHWQLCPGNRELLAKWMGAEDCPEHGAWVLDLEQQIIERIAAN